MIGPDAVEIPGSELRCRRLTEVDAQAIRRWRYPGAWAAYDLDPDDPEAAERLLASEPPHQALVLDSGELVGYFCVGEAARVSGGRYSAGALDLGLGFRPDLVGRGKGAAWARAIVRFACQKWRAPRMRATIASWNKRALRTAHFIGFRPVGAFGGFRRGSSGHFIVLVRDGEAP